MIYNVIAATPLESSEGARETTCQFLPHQLIKSTTNSLLLVFRLHYSIQRQHPIDSTIASVWHRNISYSSL